MSVSLGYFIFYVSDVGAALTFYEEAFGFTRRIFTPEEDYGELETGATTLAFVSHELAEANLAAAGGYIRLSDVRTPAGVQMTLITDSVPAALEAVANAGGRMYAEPVEKPWGQTVAYFVDPFGALVELATAVNVG